MEDNGRFGLVLVAIVIVVMTPTPDALVHRRCTNNRPDSTAVLQTTTPLVIPLGGNCSQNPDSCEEGAFCASEDDFTAGICQIGGTCQPNNRSGLCDSGFSFVCGRCVDVLDGMAEYTDAAYICSRFGATLPLMKTLKEIECFDCVNTFSSFWVGANDLDMNGEFQWLDGTPLPNNSSLWLNSPNGTGNCVTLEGSPPPDPRLSARFCSNFWGVICEKNIS